MLTLNNVEHPEIVIQRNKINHRTDDLPDDDDDDSDDTEIN